MKTIVNLCVIPIGAGVSLSPYIAVCQKVLAEMGLVFTLHANGTNIEGPWDDVFKAIKKCHQELHGMGVLRIFTTLNVGTRIDRDQSMLEKIESVKRKSMPIQKKNSA